MADELNRRDFIKRAALTTGTVSLSMAGIGSTNALGANDRIRLGVIGVGKQGVMDMKDFIDLGVEVAAVCDVYEPNLNLGLQAAGGKAKIYKDFRHVLDDKDIDVVLIGTPDHWHPLPMVEACKAGKDVYCEKPICVAVDEGKKMVEAARKYNRVAQVGLWQRSNVHFQKAVELVQSGVHRARISMVKTWNYSNMFPEGYGNFPDSEPPAGVSIGIFGWGQRRRFPIISIDLACPRKDGRPSAIFTITPTDGWAISEYTLMDIVQWAMKVQGPTGITAVGTKHLLHDNTDIPDTLQITWEFPNFVATYENRLCNNNSMFNHDYGILFHGTDATMYLSRSGFEVFPEAISESVFHKLHPDLSDKPKPDDFAKAPGMKMARVDDGMLNHVANLLECMRTRKTPNSDIEYAHRTTSTCLLGNVALRTKEHLEWDVATETLRKGGPAAQKLLSREYRAPWKLTV